MNGLLNPSPSGGRKTWETIAINGALRAKREGRLTWADVLDGQAARILACDGSEEPEKLAHHLHLLAELALDWAQNIISEMKQDEKAKK